MMAGPVDQETAKRKALDFAAAKMGSKVQRALKATDCGVHKASKRASATRDYLHVFNIDGGGYIIVSGDDRTEEILGYSITGTFDANNIPDNMRAFLQEYADGIQALDDDQVTSATPNKVKHGYQSMRAPSRAARTSVSPLMATLWDQGSPYDQYCPEYQGNKAATGCVATALAQVMGYHRWPNATTTKIPAFTTETRGLSLSAIPAGTAIDWSNIKNYYGWYNKDGNWKEETYNTTQASAVAKLMQLCGYSVQMDYYCDDLGQSGAVASNCIAALVKYFDYEESTCKWIKRENYSYTDWQDMIYAELKGKRPVLYSGQSEGGGHAFVCDGYDSDDFFHINWGWAGMSNGFFRLRLLNPDDQGIGGSSTTEGYGMGQGVGIGIKPNDGTGTYVEKMSVYDITYSEITYNRISSTDNFTLSGVTYYIINNTGKNQNFDIAVRILDKNGNKVEDLGPIMSNRTLSNGYYTWSSNIPSFGAGYANGNYKMVFIGRKTGDTEWYLCENAEIKSIDFTISGNTLSIAAPVLECSHTEEGELAAYSDITIKLNVKNTGTKGFRSDLYYNINNSGVWRAAGFVDAEPGETDVVEIKFTPTSSGNYTFTFDGIDYSFVLAIGTGGLTIPDLSGTYNYATPAISYDSSQNIYYVDGTSTTANFTVTNNGNGVYNDNIVFYFFYYSISKSDWIYYKEDVQTISLEAGGSKNLNVAIDKVDNSDYGKYCVQMYYIKENKETYLATTPDFEFRTITAGYKLEAVNYNCTPEMQYNSDAYLWYINGTEAEFYIDIKNTGTETFSGQLMVEQAYHIVGDGTSWYYKDYPTYPEYRNFTLAPGETKREKTTITKSVKDDVDGYFVRINYKGKNESSFITLEESPKFVFMDENTPILTIKNVQTSPSLNYDSEAEVYYAEGDKLTTTFTIENIGTGVYDGQVTFEYWGSPDGGYNWYFVKDNTTHDFSVTVGASESISTTIEKNKNYSIYAVECHYSKGSSVVFLSSTPDFEFREATIQSGDANGDGQVNVTDIVAIVNFIMDNSPTGFIFTAADVNNDGSVNVTDIVQIVNIIMSSGSRMDSEEVYRILKANGFIFKGE